MTSVDRDVVALLDDALHTRLFGYLQARGWKLHRAANADELADLIEQQDFHAGLLQLQHVGNYKLFDLVGRQHSLQWIALMDHSFWNPTPQHRNFLAGSTISIPCRSTRNGSPFPWGTPGARVSYSSRRRPDPTPWNAMAS